MLKKYFMFGAAAIVLGATFSSCSKEKDLYDVSAASTEFKKAFEESLGGVNANQDWKLVGSTNAQITVSLGLAQEYTVCVYNDNPLTNQQAGLLAKATVKDGQSANLQFASPLAMSTYYVAAYDSKGRGVAQVVNTDSQNFTVTLGSAATRAAEADYSGSFAKTADDYLNPKTDLWGNTLNTKQISVDEMKAYTAITDASFEGAGNQTLSDLQYTATGSYYIGNGDGKHYRVAAGTELTTKFNINGTWGVVNDAVIYVEGTMHLNGNTLNGPTIVVAGGGEVIIDGNTNMSNAGRIVVLAGGKVSGADGVDFFINNGGICYNAGEIAFNGQLNVNGSDMYNNGTINVDILRNTSGGKFTNFGQITARTNTIAGDTYNSTVINGCYMHFTENAGIGTLTLLDNSRIDVDGQAEFAGTATLYNMSEVNAGALYVTNTTFAGPTAAESFAVVKTGKIYIGRSGDIAQSGNCYFDWNRSEIYHKSNGKYEDAFTNQYSEGYWAINYQITKYVNEANSPFTIPAGECTGNGYNDNGGGGIIPEGPVYYSVAFEDLGSTDDFDFNDIVLYVAYKAAEAKADVQLMAAGGVLPVNVKYDGETIFTKNDGQMTNTSSKGSVIATKTGLSFSNPETDIYKFSIEVIDGSASYFVESAQETGIAPQALVIPGQWAWPKERQNITEAYESFASWARSSGAQDWYSQPVAARVIR